MKVRRKGSWQEWRKINKRHHVQIIGTHIITIIGVFLAAAILRYA